MQKLIVIGAGPMGLAAAYYAAKAGFDVEIVEAADRTGGMACHFDFDGLSLERFYHFCCRSDVDTLALMGELGIGEEAGGIGRGVRGRRYGLRRPLRRAGVDAWHDRFARRDRSLLGREDCVLVRLRLDPLRARSTSGTTCG